MAPSLPILLASGEPSYTPSQYMPSVLVEIAFDSNFATPAASRTWTDVTQYVELADQISIGFGRQDERSTADANDLTLTLDNSDGRFTALRSASPYYPNVKIGRPIRVSATTVDGVASIRFVGFIDEWPVEWDGTDAYAKATIRATSRQSRLGLTAKLRSTIEEQILASAPIAYYTLGDPSSSTSASESSGNLANPLTIAGDTGTTDPVFGNATGPGTDGLTACSFSETAHALAGSLSDLLAAPWSVHFAFSIAATPTAESPLFTPSQGTSVYGVDTDGLFKNLNIVAGNPDLIGPSVADGAVHDVIITSASDLYVDGVLADTSATAGSPLASFTLGGPGTGTKDRVMSHVAIFNTVLNATAAANISDAVDGFTGDRTDERLLRILAYVGVAATEVDTEVGVETMTYQLTSGQSVVDALRDVESTEGGVLFDGADGKVVFHNRSHRYQQTAAVTLNMAAQHVEADYAPRLDRSTLVNDITVENPTTGETARQVDTTSSDEYGIATGSATSVADSYDPLVQKASWHIASYAEPRMRCPSLTVDVLAHVGLTPSATDLLGITVGDLLAVTNAPSQSDTTSPTYFVEGYTETIGPESYFITFNLSPTYPTLNTFVLDSATRGLLDTGILAY